MLFVSALEAFTERDIDALEPFLDDEIEWQPTLTAGDVPLGTVYHGKEGMRTYLAELDQQFDDFTLEVESLEDVAPNHILYRGRTTGLSKTTGIRLDAPVWALWEVRDGKLIRGWSFFSETEAQEAAKAAG
jgi:ketosteroid isomerase-like protein